MIHYFTKMNNLLRHYLRHPWQIVLLTILLIFFYSTIGFKVVEGANNPEVTWADAAWWALVTMTTVGYGDISPATTLGRFLIGYPTLIVGVASIGYLLSLSASYMFESRQKARKGMKEIKAKNHILIIKFNSLAKVLQLVEEIRKDSSTQAAPIVLIDDKLKEIPVELAKKDILFVKGDPSKLNTLERANFRKAKSAIILSDTTDPKNADLKNLAIVLTLEKEHSSIYTIVECLDPDRITILKRAGSDSVICLSDMTSQIMAQELQDPGMGELLNELTSNTKGKQFYISEIPSGFKEYSEVKSRFSESQCVLIGLKDDKENILLPPPDLKIEPHHKAILISTKRPNFNS